MIKRTVSRDDRIYECFPDLTRMESGSLICVYRESEGHVPGNYTRIVARTSDDDGETWGEKVVISATDGPVDEVPGWNCPRITSMGGDRAAITCDSLLWPEGPDLERRSRIYIWWSEDGLKWEGPAETGATGIVPDRISEGKDGRLFFGTHDCSPETGRLRQILWESVDGEKWARLATIADDPHLNLCEGTLLVRDGEMSCIMRENSGRCLPGYLAVSRDNGKTWGDAMPTNLPGCHRPVAGWWGNDVLVTFRCYAGGKMKNTLLLGALIDPESLFNTEGSTGGRIFPIDYDRSIRPDTGYSGWCELPGGDVLVAYYINDDAPRAQIRCCRLSREDLEMVP